MARQCGEQGEVGGAQVDDPAPDDRSMGRFVHDQPSYLGDPGRQSARSAQQRPHPSQQLVDQIGLDEIVVRTGVEGGEQVARAPVTAQEQQQRIAVSEKPAGQSQTVVLSPEAHLEHNEIWSERRRRPGGLLRGRARRGLVAGGTERAGQRPGLGRPVHHEDPSQTLHRPSGA